MKKIKLLSLLLLIGFYASSQTIAKFSISFSSINSETAIPASINLDDFTFVHDTTITLWQLSGKTKTQIPFQVKQGSTRTLHWLINNSVNEKKLSYVLEKGSKANTSGINATSNNGSLTFNAANQNLLRYQFQTVYPPAGQDTNYKRSGFIHPLWTPHGQVLTNIQPKDHYHHYGIWNPWTHTVFEKDTIDFWNIKGHKGTVRFAKFISQTSGPVFSESELLHEHVVFKKDGTEKIALNELQTIRVYNPQGEKNYYIVDFTSQLSCATQSPFLIVAYRYAGFGWRATDEWTKDNCEVFTSEGTNRKNTDGIKARWLAAQGTL